MVIFDKFSTIWVFDHIVVAYAVVLELMVIHLVKRLQN